MDLRPRGAAAAANWSWTGPDAEVGGDTLGQPRADPGTNASSSGNDYNYRDSSTAASDASGLTAESRRDTRPPPDANEHFRRRYKPRTCRICLEVVYPTFEDVDEQAGDDEMAPEDAGINGGRLGGIGERVAGAVASAIPTFLRPQPRVRYVSEDPRDGRLVCPCHCKGSQKYVHEGCLTAWRHAQPMSARHYWTCPTCGFQYRFERLRWGRWISNRATGAVLTFAVFWLAIFLLGFIADPLIDLWLDPAGTIVDTMIDLGDTDMDVEGLANILHLHHDGIEDDSPAGWMEHFFKGFLSLGIVGVVKTFLAVSPFTWLNIRLGGGRARRRAGGQARIEGFGWLFVIVGAFTFLGVVWRAVSVLSSRVLERASERVVDVQGDDESDDDDESDEKSAANEKSDGGHEDTNNDH